MPERGWLVEPRVLLPGGSRPHPATVDAFTDEVCEVAKRHGGVVAGIGYGEVDMHADLAPTTREEASVGLFSRTDEPVKLGERYRDTITGFEGVATARYEFLHGCVRILLEGQKDNQPAEFTFDEQRLTEKPAATSGGPRSGPPSRDPAR